jgi:hypothetical protein
MAKCAAGGGVGASERAPGRPIAATLGLAVDQQGPPQHRKQEKRGAARRGELLAVTGGGERGRSVPWPVVEPLFQPFFGDASQGIRLSAQYGKRGVGDRGAERERTKSKVEISRASITSHNLCSHRSSLPALPYRTRRRRPPPVGTAHLKKLTREVWLIFK